MCEESRLVVQAASEIAATRFGGHRRTPMGTPDARPLARSGLLDNPDDLGDTANPLVVSLYKNAIARRWEWSHAARKTRSFKTGSPPAPAE